MRSDFVLFVMRKLLENDALACSDSILCVCSGQAEPVLFSGLQIPDVTLSGMDERLRPGKYCGFKSAFENAEDLSYEDGSFDFCFVSDGLHHCSHPHKAVTEMYRVARKGIVVFEARDSAVLRAATRLNITAAYEILSVARTEGKCGGQDNSCIPNYIYRWTEREFIKTIKSYDCTGLHKFRFYYGLNLPESYEKFSVRNGRQLARFTIGLVVKMLQRLFRRQCNTIAMVALKPLEVWPWLKREGRGIVFNTDHYQPG